MIRVGIMRGHFWVRWRNRTRLLWIKDVRKAEHVLYSDLYLSWHFGPFAVQVVGLSRRLTGSVEKKYARAERLMAWRESA